MRSFRFHAFGQCGVSPKRPRVRGVDLVAPGAARSATASVGDVVVDLSVAGRTRSTTVDGPDVEFERVAPRAIDQRRARETRQREPGSADPAARDPFALRAAWTAGAAGPVGRRDRYESRSSGLVGVRLRKHAAVDRRRWAASIAIAVADGAGTRAGIRACTCMATEARRVPNVAGARGQPTLAAAGKRSLRCDSGCLGSGRPSVGDCGAAGVNGLLSNGVPGRPARLSL
jgi:hypothetical protein